MSTLTARPRYLDMDLLETYGPILREAARELATDFVSCMKAWEIRRPDAVRCRGRGIGFEAEIHLALDWRRRMVRPPVGGGRASHGTDRWTDWADDELIMHELDRRGCLVGEGERHVTIVARPTEGTRCVM